MAGIRAGVVAVTEFCTAGSSLFSGYINYMDRDEAIRNTHTQDYNIYQDYMGNPYKTTGLFTAEKSYLTEEEKAEMKTVFQEAQKNGSLMWQTVISFDNRWLQKNGLWNGYLDKNSERKLHEVTRKAINEMLEKENLQNGVWTASIHLNTDNIHIHVATVEPVPMRQAKKYDVYEEFKKNGVLEKVKVGEKTEYVGRFKLSSIEACKRVVVNEITDQRDMNLRINNIIRNSIVNQKREQMLRDQEMREKFLDLHRKVQELEVKTGKWQYNNRQMAPVKKDIDELSQKFIEKYHKEDLEALKELLIHQTEIYREAYGESDRFYSQGKIDDLYTRMGNAVLRELKEYDKAAGEEKRSYQKGWQQEDGGDKDMGEGEVFSGPHMTEEPDDSETPLFRYKEAGRDRREKHGGYSIKWSDGFKKAKSYIYAHEEEKDYEKARTLLFMEAHSKNVLAIFELGNMYRYGRGVGIDEEKAQEFYKDALNGFMAIHKGNPQNAYVPYRIGMMYLQGKGTENGRSDREKAKEYLRRAANEGNVYWQMKLAFLMLEDKENLDEAETLLKKAAEKGNSMAEYGMGKLYSSEEKKDIRKAVYWYEKAAMQGHAYAEGNLGKIYYEEEDLRDVQKAVKYLQDAAEHGNRSAAYRLGKIYYFDEEVQDKQKALHFLKKAEKEEKEGYAAFQLGKIYFFDDDLKDREQAEEYFKRSVGKGNASAQEFLKRMDNDQRGKGIHPERKWYSQRMRWRYRSVNLSSAVNRLRNSLDIEYESYKNQREYARIQEEIQREHSRSDRNVHMGI